MQENEFEKQVKQMMDEFKLQPSDETWPKIDRRINGGKRRKTPFILLLVSFLLVAGFIMYRYETTTLNNEKEIAQHLNDKNILKDSNAITTHIDAQTNKKDTASLVNDERNKKMNDRSVHDAKSYSFASSNNVVDGKEKQSLQETTNQQNNNQTNQQEFEQSTKQKEDALTATANADNKDEIKQQQIENKDSLTTVENNYTIAKAGADNKNILNVDSTQKSTSKKKTSSTNTVIKLPKLQWGINAFFGSSNAVNDLVGSNKSLPSSLNAGGGNFDTSSFSSKPYAASTAYHIGFVVEKRIIKNGFIGTGLNYVHLSTKSTVGMSVDSTLSPTTAFSINRFYQSGTTSIYTNHYNFIELPVYFKQDLFPAKKFGLSYNAGLSIRQMVSSNSLVYDPYYNIYYSNNDALHKTQLQFLAGLSLKINSSKSTSFYIGPQFSYSLSSVFKSNNNFHFVNYGVQAGFMFHKK